MFGDKDVECDLLAGVSPNAFGGEDIDYTISETGRRYVPQKYSYIENNWVDGGNPLRVVADRSIVVEATYVSKTRLTCKAPSFDFPTHEEVAHKFRTSCLFDRFRPGPWPLKPPLDIDGNECRGPIEGWHPTCKAEYPAGNPTSGSRTSASGTQWLGPGEGGNLASAPSEGVRVVKNDPFPNPQRLENPELYCEEGQVCWDPSPDFAGNGLAYLQACAEPSQDCRVFCADQSATFTTLCKLGDRGEVNNHCMQIPCPRRRPRSREKDHPSPPLVETIPGRRLAMHDDGRVTRNRRSAGKTFNIVNDFTPEEEAQVREENKWCEEA